MTIPAFWRERARGLDDSHKVGRQWKRVWDWYVFTDGIPADLELLQTMPHLADFTPGWVEGGWYVDDVSAREVSPEWIQVSQSWRLVEIDNPLNVPFTITGMETIELNVPAYQDFDGKVLQTTAGEPLLGLTRPVKVWRFTGRRNIPGIPAWLANYGRATNADVVRLGSVPVPPNQLQLAQVRIGAEDDTTRIADRVIRYRPLDLEFWWNPESWTTEVLNMGFYELVRDTSRTFVGPVQPGQQAPAETYVPQRITNNGNPVDSPQFLGLDGRRFRDENGAVRSLLKPNEIVVLKFNMFERLPFGKLIN